MGFPNWRKPTLVCRYGMRRRTSHVAARSRPAPPLQTSLPPPPLSVSSPGVPTIVALRPAQMATAAGAGVGSGAGGKRDSVLTVTEYVPPTRFGFAISYPGGISTTAYTLTEHEGTTTLAVDGDTYIHHQLHKFEKQLAHGDFDASTQQAMRSGLEDTLAKLKSAIAAGSTGASRRNEAVAGPDLPTEPAD